MAAALQVWLEQDWQSGLIRVSCRFCGWNIGLLRSPGVVRSWAGMIQRHLMDTHEVHRELAWEDVLDLLDEIGRLCGWRSTPHVALTACPDCHGQHEIRTWLSQGQKWTFRTCPTCGGSGQRFPWAGKGPAEVVG